MKTLASKRIAVALLLVADVLTFAPLVLLLMESAST
jgi:hypothetical protein